MKRFVAFFIFALGVPLIGAGPSLSLPKFPLPALVREDDGGIKSIGFLTFIREVRRGGVKELQDIDFVDREYAVLESSSLPVLAAWLEAAARCVGVDLPQARLGSYDGLEYARLLQVATSLAILREHGKSLAMPIGVLICNRREAWGELPGNRDRDAYMLIATERGLLVYDPPTRQLSELSKFPNHGEIFKIQF
ncbi:MAG: hypothetical protein JWM88_1702 [Verrucomicrobia bacterium]|nr:hypothetical protein [Verrucomicrobiota bacterium]